MNQQQDTIDFRGLSETLLRYHSTILPDLLPGGKLIGREWQCGDVFGAAGNSFKFNIENGTFKDFSGGDGGKDIIALYAMQKSVSMLDSAKHLREKYLGALPIARYSYPIKAQSEPQEIVTPPIDCAAPPIPGSAQSWCYRQANGDPLFYVVRMEDRDSGKKFFYPLSFSNKGLWIKKQYPWPLPYNLDKIAADLGRPVLIVEGEKSAEAAQSVMKSYIVTTWPSGANSWNKCDWSLLKGRKVLLWPDADSVGKDCMTRLARHLLDEDIAVEVKYINTDKENGWDAYDAFVVEGMTYKNFTEWAKPIATIHEKARKVEVITPEENQAEVEATKLIDADPSDLISTEDYPVSPNLQMKYMDLGFDPLDSAN